MPSLPKLFQPIVIELNTNIDMESFSPLYKSIIGETTCLKEFLNTSSMAPLDLAFS
jgi:hypothetical protein